MSSVDIAFGFGTHLMGKDGENFQHIRKETDVKFIDVCDSNNDVAKPGQVPHHILINSDDKSKLEKAIVLGNELIDSVFDQYEEWVKEKKQSQVKGKGKDAKGKENV